MSKQSRLEQKFVAALRAHGLWLECNSLDLPGTPDIVFRSSKIVVFVNGCFWHQHQACAGATRPKTKITNWTANFNNTVARDQENAIRYSILGWTRVVVWECQLKSDQNSCVERVLETLPR